MALITFIKNQLGHIFTFLVIFFTIMMVLNLSIRKKTNYFVNFKITDVASVEIKSKRGDYLIRKGTSHDAAEWMVEHNNTTAKMEPRVPLVYFASLARIDVVEKFDTSDFTLDQLNQIFSKNKTGEITVTMKSGKQIHIVIGETTPSGTELYAETAVDKNTVYTISNRYESLLFPTLVELQRRQMIDVSSATKITFVYNGTDIELTQKGDHWTSQEKRFSTEIAAALINATKGLYFENYFENVPESDLAQYGLLIPDITVKIALKSGGIEEYIISHYGAKFYMTNAAGSTRNVFILNLNPPTKLESLLQEVTK